MAFTEQTTVGQLIAELEQFDEDTPVRYAYQPSWPFEAMLGPVVEVDVEADYGPDSNPPADEDDLDGPGTEKIVYLTVGAQLRYLPSDAARELQDNGWTADRW